MRQLRYEIDQKADGSTGVEQIFENRGIVDSARHESAHFTEGPTL
jgi:hypothetical protein